MSRLDGGRRAASHPAILRGRPGPMQRPQGPEGEGRGRGVGMSVIDAVADWSLGHAYTGLETKARLGGRVVGGNQRKRGSCGGEMI